MVSTTEFLRATSMRIGSRRNLPVSFWISGAMVAEKNSVCRLGGSLAQMLLDLGDEAHVEHAVGFVDDEDFDARHQDAAALELVEQAAGRRDQHVDATVELLVLVVEAHAADDQRDRELVVLAVFLEVLVHLRGEFAGRLEDQGARHAGAGPAAFEQREHRQHERGGLARAGLRNADDVLLFKDMRDGLRLDFGGLGVAGRSNRVGHLGAEAEPGKVFWQCVRPLGSLGGAGVEAFRPSGGVVPDWPGT